MHKDYLGKWWEVSVGHKARIDMTSLAGKTKASAGRLYNLSQVNEKRHFLELLHRLCEHIDEPPRRRGRPPLSQRVVMFAILFKIYSTVSSRRFMYDLESAFEKGYIDRVPHFNAVSHYLQKEEIKNILIDLVTLSGSSLAKLEQDFVIDSTVIRTPRLTKVYNRKLMRERTVHTCVSLHAITGARTKVIAGALTSPRYAHDTRFFCPLLSLASRRFKIERITADTSYRGSNNVEAAERIGAKVFIHPDRRTRTDGPDTSWRRHHRAYIDEREQFDEQYAKRLNVETVFLMLKSRFGREVRSKTLPAQLNETLAKAVCHNLCALIKAVYLMNVDPTFGRERSIHSETSRCRAEGEVHTGSAEVRQPESSVSAEAGRGSVVADERRGTAAVVRSKRATARRSGVLAHARCRPARGRRQPAAP